MMDIIKLEEKIMAAWNTKEDIELLYQQFLDGKEKMSEDEVANVLIGLYTIHDLRMQQLWKEFEEMASYVAQMRRK